MIRGLPKHCVYVLADPESGDVFYVGETNNFERRRAQHLEGSDQISGFKVKLLREVRKEPIVQVIEHCMSDEAALMAEISWIRYFLSIGAPLLNSQSFDSSFQRQQTHKGLKSVLDEVTGGKYGKDGLRHVANGRTYHNQGAKHATGNPVTQVKGPFSAWEKEKLRRMHRQRMPVWEMAQVLNRDLKDVRAQIRLMS